MEDLSIIPGGNRDILHTIQINSRAHPSSCLREFFGLLENKRVTILRNVSFRLLSTRGKVYKDSIHHLRCIRHPSCCCIYDSNLRTDSSSPSSSSCTPAQSTSLYLELKSETAAIPS